jgi:hypothetical protein
MTDIVHTSHLDTRDSALVVGCGESLRTLHTSELAKGIWPIIACNRAIECVQADYWVWLDSAHHSRSRWHPNALNAVWVGPQEQQVLNHEELVLYEIGGTLPSTPSELYLHGGTLTIAAHLAVRLGARQIAFAACDAWHSSRDRYHEWDGTPLDADGLNLHQAG